MPRRPTEFDMVEHHLQQAARAIRDSRPMDLGAEQLRNRIYDHIHQAIDIMATYAYSTGSDLQHPYSLSSPPTGRGGGGAGGWRGGGTQPISGKDLTFDLDLLK